MAKRVSPDAVIDLTFDSDNENEQESRYGDIRKHLYHKTQNKKTKTSRNALLKNEAIGKRSPSTPLDDDDDDEVEIVDAPAPKVTVASLPTNNTNGDGDIEMVGTVNETRLPHMRQHCTKFKFQTNHSNRAEIRTSNEKHCDLCYCFVCDCPVKDCKSWICTSGSGLWHENHCNANEQINWELKRKLKRQHAANQKQTPRSTTPTFRNPYASTSSSLSRPSVRPSSSSSRTVPVTIAISNCFDSSDFSAASSDSFETFENAVLPRPLFGDGPFEPNNAQAAADSQFTACRKCGWHSKTDTMRHRHNLRCLRCGRITVDSEKRKQGVRYSRKDSDISLGERTITFRIVPLDVRVKSQYCTSWREADVSDPTWKYDEAEMEADVFNFRIGTYPSPSLIVDMTTIWEESKMRRKNEEGIILDNYDDMALLQVLKKDKFEKVRRSFDSAKFFGDMKAEWNKTKRSGKLTIRLFLPKECLEGDEGDGRMYSFLLGSWFNIFPFKLTDISGPIEAAQADFTGFPRLHQPTNDQKKEFQAFVKEHNKSTEEFSSQLSLTSSTGNIYIGGTTNNDNSMKGIFRKLYRESFCTSQCGLPTLRSAEDWEKRSNHQINSSEISKEHDYILNYKDRVRAGLCFGKACDDMNRDLESTKGALEHLENVGHGSELTCEGLSVELLAFQKQSLKWALERETIPGGIQSYFWAKVPVTQELYYNPIFYRFKKDKPREVRGGIIAEEMGLGKTVISLALILKHPAPTLPASGSTISALYAAARSTGEGASKWDMRLYNDNSIGKGNLKRGSILSQGTLVICPVSLVGQWIEEAKSKLKNPGLLYPYHGANRKRDPNILAKNAIVVTTYQVLASDDTHHRRKSLDPNYCPPLEQVRWWRIICDEGHFLRQPNTNRNRSVSNIVADHKWLVTGTPVNTSVMDLKNQLAFLGIEDVDSMFERFCFSYSSRGRGRNGNRVVSSPGKLMFFLRSLMMRHTQKQSYRGTKTTLMSLPPKSEHSIEITLSTAEKKEYDLLDNAAKTFYLDFKARHCTELSKHYLKLSQKLTPMKIACSGGRIPLGGQVEEEDKPVERNKEEVKYSDFCFTAKFNVLLRELKQAKDKDPSSKSLVFSQYSSTLNWLKEELPKHGFGFRTLSGKMSMNQRAKALYDFQSDPPTTIFLLSMRAGNCGINLTQANRVFLMEPGFNPALEQQAIGRVYRLGQKRKVKVIRLLVKDSVETRIHEFLKHKYGGISSDAKKAPSASPEDDHNKKEENLMGPVGNIASEKPKSKILGEEFDILFGVKAEDLAKAEKSDDRDAAIPGAAPSVGII